MTKQFYQTKASPSHKGQQRTSIGGFDQYRFCHFPFSLFLYHDLFSRTFSVFLYGGSRTSLSFGGPLVILIVESRPKCQPQTALKDYRPVALDRRPHLPVRPGPAASDDSCALTHPPRGGQLKSSDTLPPTCPFTSFVVQDMSSRLVIFTLTRSADLL